jgi:hypothetical protein
VQVEDVDGEQRDRAGEAADDRLPDLLERVADAGRPLRLHGDQGGDALEVGTVDRVHLRAHVVTFLRAARAVLIRTRAAPLWCSSRLAEEDAGGVDPRSCSWMTAVRSASRVMSGFSFARCGDDAGELRRVVVVDLPVHGVRGEVVRVVPVAAPVDDLGELGDLGEDLVDLGDLRGREVVRRLDAVRVRRRVRVDGRGRGVTRELARVVLVRAGRSSPSSRATSAARRGGGTGRARSRGRSRRRRPDAAGEVDAGDD